MLQGLFSTQERNKVLYYILEDPETIYRVNDVARKLKLNKGTISTYFRFLLKNNILKNRGRGFVVNLNSPLTRQIKVLLNLRKINIKPILGLKPKGIGLYGSWAKGVNGKTSDVDIWITFDKRPKEEKIAAAQAKMRNKLKYEIGLLVIDEERLKGLKKDEIFYHSLVFDSIVLWGEGLET